MSALVLKYQQQLGETFFDIDLELPSSGITAIFGRSGAGKTSLINAISGLKQPDKGLISISGTTLFDSERGINLPTHKRNVGYVFQESRLFPHLSLIHISEPTRLLSISYAVFCLKKKKK